MRIDTAGGEQLEGTVRVGEYAVPRESDINDRAGEAAEVPPAQFRRGRLDAINAEHV